MWAAIFAVIQALMAYVRYRFDPAQIARRDEINKQAALEGGLNEINQALADKNILSLSFFVSEFLRTKGSDSTPRWAADLIARSLPTPRDDKTRSEDTEDGPDIGT